VFVAKVPAQSREEKAIRGVVEEFPNQERKTRRLEAQKKGPFEVRR